MRRNQSNELTCPGKLGHAAHVKRYAPLIGTAALFMLAFFVLALRGSSSRRST
jgi:hypothetical protein